MYSRTIASLGPQANIHLVLNFIHEFGFSAYDDPGDPLCDPSFLLFLFEENNARVNNLRRKQYVHRLLKYLPLYHKIV